MNILQLIADNLHLLSFLIIIAKVHKSKTVQELSYRTFEIYFVVFLTRYANIFSIWISAYTLTYKILFLSATGYLIFLIRVKKPYKLGYNPLLDNFPHYFFLYPLALTIAVLFHISASTYRYSFKYFEYFLSFSIWLEAFAIIP